MACLDGHMYRKKYGNRLYKGPKSADKLFGHSELRPFLTRNKTWRAET